MANCNILTGKTWHATGDVFKLMCPLTQTNCHSMCVCFKENRTKTTFRGTDEDIAFRGDGYAFGYCEHFGFSIGTYRD